MAAMVLWEDLEEVPVVGVVVAGEALTSVEAEVQAAADQAAPGNPSFSKFTSITFTFCNPRTIFVRSTTTA